MTPFLSQIYDIIPPWVILIEEEEILEDVILVAEEVETDKCIELSAPDVAKIVRFLSDQQAENQYFVVSVLKEEIMVEMVAEEMIEVEEEVPIPINFKDSLLILRLN